MATTRTLTIEVNADHTWSIECVVNFGKDFYPAKPFGITSMDFPGIDGLVHYIALYATGDADECAGVPRHIAPSETSRMR